MNTSIHHYFLRVRNAATITATRTAAHIIPSTNGVSVIAAHNGVGVWAGIAPGTQRFRRGNIGAR
ncbi:MAG: hypothetical protein ACTSPB_08480, partial [Candidatus Thorarchaeota archaeon]